MTWNWTLLDAGRFRLDGGSMFGVVPKALWSRLVEPDEKNRIPEACNCVLLEKDGKRVLIETGYGDGWSDKEVDMFAMNGTTILDALNEHSIDQTPSILLFCRTSTLTMQRVLRYCQMQRLLCKDKSGKTQTIIDLR
jgi:hypothetical protein